MIVAQPYDPYQGDPKKILTSRGATLQFRGGQPLNDQGIENAIMYSLFTKKWFANGFFRDPAQRFDSKFETESAKPINSTQLLNIEDAARDALKWMIDKAIVSSFDITTAIPVFNKVQTEIIVHPPGDDAFTILLTKHGQNWLAQALYPANERVVIER